MRGTPRPDERRRAPVPVVAIRSVLAVACGLLPAVTNADAAVTSLGVLAVVLLAQSRSDVLTVLGAGAVVAELAVSGGHHASGADLSIALVEGLLLLALSGCTHSTHRIHDPAGDLAVVPAALLAVAAVVVVPSLGSFGLLAGCAAAVPLAGVVAYRSTATQPRSPTAGGSSGKTGTD